LSCCAHVRGQWVVWFHAERQRQGSGWCQAAMLLWAAAAARLLLCWLDFVVPAGMQWVGRRAPTRACRAASRGVWDVARSRVRGAGSACVIRWPPRSLLRRRLGCTVAPWWCHCRQQAAASTTAYAQFSATERAAALRFLQCTASSQTAAADQAAYTATHPSRACTTARPSCQRRLGRLVLGRGSRLCARVCCPLRIRGLHAEGGRAGGEQEQRSVTYAQLHMRGQGEWPWAWTFTRAGGV
jgi:hypothetical protein